LGGIALDDVLLSFTGILPGPRCWHVVQSVMGSAGMFVTTG
jgi:hypothetical protein